MSETARGPLESSIVGRWLTSVEFASIAALRRLADVDRRAKRAILIAIDCLTCLGSVWLAFSLRLSDWVPVMREMALVVAVALPSWFAVASWNGVYRSIVRYAGGRTMVDLAVSVVLAAIPGILLFLFNSVPGVPRTVPLIQPMVFLLAMGIVRVSLRYALVELAAPQMDERKNVIIYGGGVAGQQLAASIRHDPKMNLVAFVDTDSRLRGERLNGVPIASDEELPALVRSHQVTDVLLAMPSAPRSHRRKIVEQLVGMLVHVQVLPAVSELIEGRVSANDLREVQLEDLLGRDPVPPNTLLLHKTIAGRTVLLTGAGGSIGSELARQILQLSPDRLILVEQSEFGLYRIEQELSALLASAGTEKLPVIVSELANVADADVVERLLKRYRPHSIFHAAAYKHVPLVEANPISGIRNNVFSTLYLAQCASRFNVENFVLVSTDKAVRPTNVMGASKRVCELVLQALAEIGGDTCYAMVRFGNVLGSSGSVVPRFQQQIRAGGPITLTHRDVTRYFMTIPEAAQLVIQAGALAKGGEVFVLDMGQSVKIYELACSMVRLSGLTVRDEENPDGDIEIAEIGLRPGEKLYEELLIGEDPQRTLHPRIMKANESKILWQRLEPALNLLKEHLSAGNVGASVAMLEELVPECRLREGGRGADSLLVRR